MDAMIARLTDGLSRRAFILLAGLLAVLLAAPWIANDYLLTVLIVILYLAYTGQAWNIMMGFAGQLSLGHAIYVGLGAYIPAVLFTRLGIGPWVGLLAAVPVAAACGAIIGFLAFRFGVAGVYFAILTIAFAEFARIGFDHLTIVNASAGLFLPVAQLARNDLWRLPLDGDRKPQKYLATPAEEMHGNFSPDGHLVAYTSNESGKFEVYVQTFPQLTDLRKQVSISGRELREKLRTGVLPDPRIMRPETAKILIERMRSQ